MKSLTLTLYRIGEQNPEKCLSYVVVQLPIAILKRGNLYKFLLQGK